MTMYLTETSKMDKLKKVAKSTALLAALGATYAMPELVAAAGQPTAASLSNFDSIVQFVMGELNGSLGTLIIACMIAVGLIGGIVNQSMIAFAVGIGSAIGFAFLEQIITAVLGASVQLATSVSDITPVLHSLSNGL